MKSIIYKRTIFLVSFIIIFLSFIYSSHPSESLKEWNNFIESDKSSQLIKWLKVIAFNELKGILNDNSKEVRIKTPIFYGQLGIFVTLTKDRKVRGCYGSFNPSSNDIQVVLCDYIKNALRSDIRYKPLSLEELPELEIIITITSQPYPINDINSVDISQYGVMIKSENQIPVVFVPAEIRTHSYMNRIIKKYTDPELFVFKAVTIRSY